ncbi:hypothetical protein WMY93_030618 [Mugilogobius chulae]|uniref:Uncharacterized protein n=1 Tax=Mugilogobius chulae TaxID=88201 RepID=A0AAW0MWN2_9GOBI
MGACTRARLSLHATDATEVLSQDPRTSLRDPCYPRSRDSISRKELPSLNRAKPGLKPPLLACSSITLRLLKLLAEFPPHWTSVHLLISCVLKPVALHQPGADEPCWALNPWTPERLRLNLIPAGDLRSGLELGLNLVLSTWTYTNLIKPSDTWSITSAGATHTWSHTVATTNLERLLKRWTKKPWHEQPASFTIG